MKPTFDVNAIVAYSPYCSKIRSAHEYYHGLGDYTRKNAAKRELERLEALQGTLVELLEPRPMTTAWRAVVNWQDGTTSHLFASDLREVK